MTEYEIRIRNIVEKNPYMASGIITATRLEVYECDSSECELYKEVLCEYNLSQTTGEIYRLIELPRAQNTLPEEIKTRIEMYMVTIHTLWDR